ncbi:hypothetical protein RJ55_03065 [Drechmeria coniospora]|nr:hypothetical protein RJ55_03065 [Drechmeria coniospora]
MPEKIPPVAVAQSSFDVQKKSRGCRPKPALIIALGFLAATSVWHGFQRQRYGPGGFGPVGSDGKHLSWSWEDVEPSRSLAWTKCYDVFKCARLDVPMDWQSPSDDKRVTLGIMKLPAKATTDRLPPVFVNPGGPGGSGIYFMQILAAQLQRVVGENQDIISWDPRGVGVSTPRVECWGTSQKRELWSMQDKGVIDERPGLIYDTYSRGLAYSGACERALNDSGILLHLSTAYHARDMLEILDGTGHQKLRYWGFSYGTALGGAFAGMFPGRVERLVSDGNVDYREYFGTGARHYLDDADTIFDAFDSACHGAGPKKCALWASTPGAIQKRRTDLLERLKRRPIIIPAQSRESGPEMPEQVTYTKLQRMTQGLVYAPIWTFKTMAQVYAALEAGDGLPYYDLATAMKNSPGSELLCERTDTPATRPRETQEEQDAFPGIMCSDSDGSMTSLGDFEQFAETLSESSRWMGAAFADLGAGCAGRSIRPKWRFTIDMIKQDTDFPILYIGNLADNVTPLQSARNNSALFPSSVVLTQKSYGHCSLAAPSTCTLKLVRAYFQNGTVPSPGTECEQDFDLFELPTPEELAMKAGQQDALSTAAYELSLGGDFLMHRFRVRPS